MISKIVSHGFKTGFTGKSATYHLQDAGFTVLDITGLNGKTYFCARERPSSGK